MREEELITTVLNRLIVIYKALILIYNKYLSDLALKELTVREMLEEFEIMDDTYYKKDRDTQMSEKYTQISAQIEEKYSSHGKIKSNLFGF